MSVSSNTNRVIYNGNGSTVDFPITFDYLDDSDNVVVTLRTVATGAETTLTETTHYSIADDTVTTVSTYSSAYQIILSRDVDYTQETDWVENERFSADVLESALDKLTMLTQQLYDLVQRSITIPVGDAIGLNMAMPSDVERASKYLAFDSSGGAVATAGNGSTTPISTWAETLVDDTSASAARTTLGAGSAGSAVFTAASEASGRTALGAGTAGAGVFTAETEASARTAAGATSVGVSLFTATSAAAARTALSVPSVVEAVMVTGSQAVAGEKTYSSLATFSGAMEQYDISGSHKFKIYTVSATWNMESNNYKSISLYSAGVNNELLTMAVFAVVHGQIGNDSHIVPKWNVGEERMDLYFGNITERTVSIYRTSNFSSSSYTSAHVYLTQILVAE